MDVVGVSTKVSLNSLKFDVVQSKAAPKAYSHEVEINKAAKKVIEANQNSFIHIQFTVLD